MQRQISAQIILQTIWKEKLSHSCLFSSEIPHQAAGTGAMPPQLGTLSSLPSAWPYSWAQEGLNSNSVQVTHSFSIQNSLKQSLHITVGIFWYLLISFELLSHQNHSYKGTLGTTQFSTEVQIDRDAPRKKIHTTQNFPLVPSMSDSSWITENKPQYFIQGFF